VKPAGAGGYFHGFFLKRTPTSLPVVRSKGLVVKGEM
jgi:hypothetical protein